MRGILEFGLTDPELGNKSAANIFGYLNEAIQERKANLREDDLMSYLLTATVDGEPVPEPHVLGTCGPVPVAGSTRRGVRSARRCGTLRSTPRIALA